MTSCRNKVKANGDLKEGEIEKGGGAVIGVDGKQRIAYRAEGSSD